MKKAFITVAVILLLVAIGVTSNAIAGADDCPSTPTAPGAPSPTNGSTGTSTNITLSWNAAANASYYEVRFGTSEPNYTYNNSYPLPPLDINTTYYWQVIARNDCGFNYSDIWNFTTVCPVPDKPQPTSPMNGADQIFIQPCLSWNASANASYYDVYFGTSATPPYYGNTSNSSYQLPLLNDSTPYYWQVVARNTCGNNSSDIWNFIPRCPVPAKPQTPSPANGSANTSTNILLSWNASANASVYDVYFGTSATPTLNGSTNTNSYQLPQLNINTTYYWQVAARNTGKINFSDIWSFTTACPVPDKPQIPSPTNGSNQISINAYLSWHASANASSYDVYFGTSATPPYYGNTSNSSYQLPQLSYSTQYYWKVAARNACGINSSDIWNFTTGCPVPDKPQTPSPTNGSSTNSTIILLSWHASSNASYYDVYFGTSATPTYYGNTSNNSYQLPQLNQSAQYYWKVVARNACGNNSSDIWNFTTGSGCPVPTMPQTPSPTNGSTNTSTIILLSWNASANTSLYDIYLGTSATPPYYGNTSNSSYQVSLSNYSTKYYWKVVANSSCGNNSSDIWNFTTGCPVPDKPQTPSPTNGSSTNSTIILLSWNSSANASLYDVYFGTSATPPYYGNTSNSSYQLPQFNQSTQYYWKVVARNACGNNSSDIWEFTTVNASAATPTPVSTIDLSIGGTFASFNTSSGVIQQPVNVTSVDGTINLHIPAGTTALYGEGGPLDRLNMASINDYPYPSGNRKVVAAFDFNPAGATFNPGIAITLRYDPAKIPSGVSESKLVVAFYNESAESWEYISNGVVNTSAHTITFTTTHFTVFAIQTPAEMPLPVGNGGIPVWLWIALGLGGALTLVTLAAIFIIANKRSQEERGASGTHSPSRFHIPRPRRAPKPPKSK